MDLASEPGLTSALRARGYQVRGPAGVGRGGAAWAATSRDGRRCVVGVVDLDVTLAERRAALARLERLRSFDHPHVVPLIDAVPLDGHRTALVTEALEGPTVGAVLAVRRALRAGEVVTLVVPLAGALRSLHEHGLVHADVAPENVVLAPGGRPVLVDLASIVLPAGGTRGFADTRTVGTPRGDVRALARLGVAALGDGGAREEAGEDAALRTVLEATLRDETGPSELASGCYDAVRAEPVEVPDPAVLTRVALSRLNEAAPVERTLADPRARRRRLARRAVAGVSAVAAVVAGLSAVLPDRDDVAQRGAVAAASQLTERRAEVLSSLDPARLPEVTVEGSPAFAADAALMSSLVAQSQDVEVDADVIDSQWIGQREGAELVAVTFAQRVGDRAGAPRSVVLALVDTHEGWRVVDVLEHEDAADVTGPVGPLAG